MSEKLMLDDPLSSHLRARYSLPDNWHVWYYSIEGNPPCYRAEGSQYRTYVRPPRTGQPDWNNALSPTLILFIGVQEHHDWCVEWARKNGRCTECIGAGNTWHKWKHTPGGETKPCRSCNGTGDAH